MFLLLETLKPPHKLTRVHDSFFYRVGEKFGKAPKKH